MVYLLLRDVFNLCLYKEKKEMRAGWIPTWLQEFEKEAHYNKEMKGFINKLITHNRDKEGDYGIRATLHFPFGVMIVASVLAHPVLPIVLTWLFIRYEENEDIHTKDQAWKDYYGAIAGAVVGILALIGLHILGE